jgi:hypothetical protein
MKISVFLLTIAFFSLCCPFAAYAQSKKQEKKAVEDVLNRFFRGLSGGDTVLLKSTCVENPIFQTIVIDKSGNTTVVSGDFKEFVAVIGTPRKEKIEERIQIGNIEVEPFLASAWTPYRFFVDGRQVHCGTNSFQMVKVAGAWKIQYIIDTRRKTCD